MRKKFGLTLTLVIVLSSQIFNLVAHANPDDGYPAGQVAPGRTCPQSAVNDQVISEFNQKIFVCTLIDGQKKWWIKGEPLPTVPSTAAPTGTPVIPKLPDFENLQKQAAIPTSIKQSKNIVYGNLSKTQVLNLYTPKTQKIFPLILWFHGGGMKFGNREEISTNEYIGILKSFVESGYAVASIEYRLSGEAKFPAAVQDAKSAARFLRANAKKYSLNPNQFTSMGPSAGGFLAAALGVTSNQNTIFDLASDKNSRVSGAVQAAVLYFPAINYLTLDSDNVANPIGSKELDGHLKDGTVDSGWLGNFSDPTNALAWKQASLNNYVISGVKFPAFKIFHGTADTIINSRQSTVFNELLKLKGANSEVKLFEGEGHGTPKIYAETKNVITFLNKLFKVK